MRPLEIVQGKLDISPAGLLPPEQLVSVGLNPPPETVTTVPLGAALGDRVMVGDGVVTVNVVVAKSPVVP